MMPDKLQAHAMEMYRTLRFLYGVLESHGEITEEDRYHLSTMVMKVLQKIDGGRPNDPEFDTRVFQHAKPGTIRWSKDWGEWWG